MLRARVGHSFLEVVQGDITEQDTEAIVNAANTELAPGGGVAGAIHSAAGPKLWEECRTLGGCRTGEAKLTKAYELPSKYIIHTVGPVYSGIDADEELLKNCYFNSLQLADFHKIRTISFPAISTGIFGYPVKDASEVAMQTIINYLEGETNIELVRIVLYFEFSYKIHEKTFKEFIEKK
jgi:O-acetyl-ADP-ribose deacetylase (regulator of RNase III)